MNQFDPNKVFFTSDTHFWHKNIINLCSRPYENVEEMNTKLIENWNKVVPQDGLVFHLGDFAFGGFNTKWKPILDQLNGKIWLIEGNHDLLQGNYQPHDKLVKISKQIQIRVENRSVYLNHYPFLCYGGTYRSEENAVWQLFGHVHSGPNSTGADTDRLKYLFPYQYDVGVDNNNYMPVTWEQVKAIINQQLHHEC